MGYSPFFACFICVVFYSKQIFSKPQPAENTEVQSQTLQNTANTPSAVNAVQGSDSLALQSGSDEGTSEGEDADTEEVLEEREYVIETKTIKVRFTNRGGDIIGYELKDHSDGGTPVQMAENISPTNRAFALAFGGAANAIINDLFNAKIIDDRTIGFYKNSALPIRPAVRIRLRS